MSYFGPTQTVRGETRASLYVVATEPGLYTINTSPIAQVSPASFSLQDGETQVITINTYNYGEYAIHLNTPTQGTIDTTIKFEPAWPADGTTNPFEVRHHLIGALSTIQVTPAFNMVAYDNEGYFDVNRDRQYVLLYDGWETGEIFGTIVATYRLMVGYLDRDKTAVPDWDTDTELIKQTLYIYQYPTGVLGVNVVSSAVTQTSDLVLNELTIEATIRRT